MNKKLFTQLTKTILSQDSEESLGEFLKGILTPDEIEKLCTRLEIAKMLKQKIPQREIAEKLGIGIATVTRGSRELKRGSFKNL